MMVVVVQMVMMHDDQQHCLATKKYVPEMGSNVVVLLPEQVKVRVLLSGGVGADGMVQQLLHQPHLVGNGDRETYAVDRIRHQMVVLLPPHKLLVVVVLLMVVDLCLGHSTNNE